MYGYSLGSPTEPSLFNIVHLDRHMCSTLGDIRDFKTLQTAFLHAEPEIVFHLAAQPLVRESYRAPVDTYETNVIGTVNLLECVRHSNTVRSVVNVTTDKVYRNNEWAWGYRENDALDGYDPYSNSKSCSELITHSYAGSFLSNNGISVSTARAGNVIGGGDFAQDRIIPDCIRAALRGTPIAVRNPSSTRPYQHVLEPLFAYLLIAMKQYNNPQYADWYNIGPDDCDCVTTGELVTAFCSAWKEGCTWEQHGEEGPHEAHFLKLDSSLIKSKLGWAPRWHIEEAVQRTCEWTKIWMSGADPLAALDAQIDAYLELL